MLTVGKNHDHITVCDGGNPVCYGDHRAPWKLLLDDPLQDGVGGRVDGRRRLVEDQDPVPAEEDAREAEELPLPGAPVLPVIAHWRCKNKLLITFRTGFISESELRIIVSPGASRSSGRTLIVFFNWHLSNACKRPVCQDQDQQMCPQQRPMVVGENTGIDVDFRM